jgi:hypothetical protein
MLITKTRRYENTKEEGLTESPALFRLPCEIAQALFHWVAFQISPVPLNSRGSGTIQLGCFCD